MSLIYKQAPTSPLKKANELMDNSVNVNPTIFKHLLKCTSCLWNITFYESTGKSIPVNSKKNTLSSLQGKRNEIYKNKNHFISTLF